MIMELCTPGAMMAAPAMKSHLEKMMAICTEHNQKPYQACNSTADIYDSSVFRQPCAWSGG